MRLDAYRSRHHPSAARCLGSHSFISASPRSSQYVMSVSRYIVVAVVRPAWVSATEVAVMSTANTAGPRPATAVARRSFIYDAAASRWVVKPGTYRQS